ncbi:hypothetical protein BS17DRAFT_800033 [Gyrodon lividus]|nr:hypothetical protein BS17DRAFT_800033 [Gyrodon lividus]
MPSLRRSFSSPFVRSSPYPSSLSSGNPSGNRARTTGQQPRRSSGSDTTGRRVLADIEWWRVYDGQCDLEAQDQGQDQGQTQHMTDISAGGVVMLAAGGGSLEPPQTPPLLLHSFSLDLIQSMPTNESAALSIAPYSPSSRRHGRDSSFSSQESILELTTAPLEPMHFGPAADRFSRCSVSAHSPLAASPIERPPSRILRIWVVTPSRWTKTSSSSFLNHNQLSPR